MTDEKKTTFWQKVRNIFVAVGGIWLFSFIRKRRILSDNTNGIKQVGKVIDGSTDLVDEVTRRTEKIAKSVDRAGQGISNAQESINASLDIIENVRKRGTVKKD